MEIIGLGLGSNLGDRAEMLRKAIGFLGNSAFENIQLSKVYETEPWGFVTENSFLNMVLTAQTTFSPSQLLEEIIRIEQILGRVRVENQYSDRPIDLDILFYGSQSFKDSQLEIPHPRMHSRRFVLEPLRDINPMWQHPITGVFIEDLIEKCTDNPLKCIGEI
jgi:2-amino-4-hydroxy-6-hydroxymethyldihydropteridine diphosphokinase